HRGGDVDTVHGLEMQRQRLRDPADAAAEVQGTASTQRKRQRFDVAKDAVDLVPPPGEELSGIPSASLVREGEDGEERIFPGRPLPVPAETSQGHPVARASEEHENRAELVSPLLFRPAADSYYGCPSGTRSSRRPDSVGRRAGSSIRFRRR